MAVIRIIASLKLTLIGLLLLTVGSVLIYGNPVDVSMWVLVIPLFILAVNLLAAIISNKRIHRQSGLLVFHVGLLGIVLLAGLGRLLHFDANIEITRDKPFMTEDLMDINKGPLHAGNIEDIFFVQGAYSVEYAPGMQRGLTYSTVIRKDRSGELYEEVVGDDRPLVIEDYRFYTTFNKGFAVNLTWTGEAEEMSGVVHLPSYPLFDYKQSNSWTPPGSEEIKFWLRLQTGLNEEISWVLSGDTSSAVLIVNIQNERIELSEGESVELQGGELRYNGLTTWMGYRIFYDPTIQWLFWMSIVSILGLSWHFWRKLSQPV